MTERSGGGGGGGGVPASLQSVYQPNYIYDNNPINNNKAINSNSLPSRLSD
jgi:hypothetical protein